MSDVAYSPSGKRLLTTSADGTVRLWSLRSRKGPWTAPALTASASGRFLAWKSNDQVVVYDLESARVNRVSPLPRTPLHSLTLNAEGTNMLVVVHDPTTARSNRLSSSLWDSRVDQVIGNMFPLDGDPTRQSLSPDGMKISLAIRDRLEVNITSSGKRLASFVVPDTNLTSLAWSRSSDRLAAASGRTLLLIDPQHSTLLWTQEVHHSMALSKVTFSKDGRRIATATGDKTISPGEARIWDTESGKEIGIPIRHKDGVSDVAFSVDGRWIATGSEDFTAQVWDSKTGIPMSRSLRHQDEVSSVAFSTDGHWLVTACRDGSARVWDLETSEPLTPPLRHAGRLAAARLVGSDTRLLTETRDGKMWLWILPFDQRPSSEIRQWARILSADRSETQPADHAGQRPSLESEFQHLSR